MTLIIIAAAIVMIFGFVVLFGAPYLPTFKKEGEIALDLLDLKKGQSLYELGCGDGRILRLAARRGIRCVGYELNPILALIARISTLRYRKQVEVRWGNFWKADLSRADGVFVFLIDGFMDKLDKKMNSNLKKGGKLVSYAFRIPGKKAVETRSAMFLYQY